MAEGARLLEAQEPGDLRDRHGLLLQVVPCQGRLELQTTIEAYTPMYALFLPREDFVRASNSLQLDEVVAIYIAKILGTDYHLAFMKNGHPLVPLSTLQAGYRLMMHGPDVEGLHGWLRVLKRRQAAGLPLDPRNPTSAGVTI